jgi:PAS domain S-box-containing protein
VSVTPAAIIEDNRVVERLRKQNQVLNTLLDNVDAHIYIKDREGRFLYVNQAVAELLGRPIAEIVGTRA